MTEKEVKQDLMDQLDFYQEDDYDSNHRSWGYEEGILITPAQARMLLNILIYRATPREYPMTTTHAHPYRKKGEKG